MLSHFESALIDRAGYDGGGGWDGGASSATSLFPDDLRDAIRDSSILVEAVCNARESAEWVEWCVSDS